jgi:CheY-like chemotaxis protein
MGKRATNFPTVPIEQAPQDDSHLSSHVYRPVVLVVDDEAVIADTLSEILVRSGYMSVVAYDGESALESALLMPPEMLITDVVLPGMSGIELAITVKRVFPDCKIILFSGQAACAELLARADKSGHHFTLLAKPVHPTDLLARVAETLPPRHRTAIAAAAN